MDALLPNRIGSGTASIEVFWPDSGGYSTRAVTGTHYPAKRWTRIILLTPPQRQDAVLRLDPCSVPGVLEIAAIRITRESRHGMALKIRKDNRPEGLSFEDLVPVDDPRAIRLVSLGVDPKIYLPPLPDELAGRRLRIDVLIRLEPSSRAALAELRSHFPQLDKLATFQDRLEAQAARIAELERIEPELQRARDEGKAEASTTKFLRGELSHVRKELDWARNEIERLRRDGERRKIAVRNAERSFQFRFTLPSFLLNKNRAKTAPESGFEFQVESPKSLQLVTDAATISGWCFTKSGECIQSIRARVADRIFEGQYGRKRFDVQAVFPNYGNSGHCGFEIELTGLPARFEVLIEVLGDDDRWRLLTSLQGRVAKSIFGADRSLLPGGEGLAMTRRIMTLAPKEERLFKKEIAKMTERPRVSIIMPVYNTPADYLRQAIESVKAQVYPEWQLCIADDLSTSEATRKVLEEAVEKDSRISVVWRQENGGIATASNSALDLAQGDIIALMDHDDLLSPVATLRLAQVANMQAADFIYSDEALINPAGEFVSGTYRPAFSLSYLRSHPYIVHLVAFSARLIREIGGFTDGLRISQDYDLILRAAEKASCITHIPEILYLWRQLPTSAGHVHQDSVTQVSSGLLREHFDRSNLPAEVSQGFGFNFFQSSRKDILADRSVAIIIPTKNHAALLRQCVESLERTLPQGVAVRLVIVDHDSDEEDAVELLSELRARHTVLSYSGSFNYSAINNFAVRHGAGDAEFLIFSNNDIEAIEPGWIERLLDAAVDPSVGAVAPLLLYPDNETVQHAGVSVGLCGIAEHLGKFLPMRAPDGSLRPGYQGLLRITREVAAITTGFALVRRGAFEAVGGFSEELQVGYNDTDLCLRLWQAGYRVLYCGETLLLHHESATRGKTFKTDPHPADSRRFRESWGWLIERGDPFYSPNLRADSTSWESSPIMSREAKPRLRSYSGPASLFKK